MKKTAFLILMLISADCFADKVCLKVALKNEAVKTRVRNIASSETCPRGFKEIVNTDTLSGPTGATGSSGASLLYYSGGTGTGVLNSAVYYSVNGVSAGSGFAEGTANLIGSSCSQLEITVRLGFAPGVGNSRDFSIAYERPGIFSASSPVCTVSGNDLTCSAIINFPDGFGNTLEATDMLTIGQSATTGAPTASEGMWVLRCLAN